MNREDIIRTAREATKEAPREDWNSTAWVFGDETLEHFAALVASAEREACAKVCDEIYFQNYPDAEEWEQSEEGEAIRKRSHV